jgi:hypothetical protein
MFKQLDMFEKSQKTQYGTRSRSLGTENADTTS